jgi:GntR family transcriptional regulator, transcriptional repressor for pyruvate dehydrogenase complex
MATPGRRRRKERTAECGADQVVAYVRKLIERKLLRPGDRLPAERDLATQIGVSRPTVRMGLHALAALGCIQARHGSGTYIPAGPPALTPAPLSLLASLHDFRPDQMYDARRILEVGAAGLAAECATPEQTAALAEEVASLFASMDDRQRFLLHDITFHRTVAAASGNPIIAAVVDMVASLYYERRRRTAEQASLADMRDAAHSHRAIYLAIRSGDADSSRRAMNDHLQRAHAYQVEERQKPARQRRVGAV